jgi:AcrR family transcriptional regulator
MQIRERGFDGLTMDGVKERACVSRALLYNHFESHEDLVLALYMREIRELDRRILTATQRAVGFEAKARAAIRAYFDFEESHGDVFGQLQMRQTKYWYGPDTRDPLTEIFTRWATLLISARIEPEVAQSLARASLGATELLVTSWRYGAISRAAAEAMAFQLSIAGLRAASTVRAGVTPSATGVSPHATDTYSNRA